MKKIKELYSNGKIDELLAYRYNLVEEQIDEWSRYKIIDYKYENEVRLTYVLKSKSVFPNANPIDLKEFCDRDDIEFDIGREQIKVYKTVSLKDLGLQKDNLRFRDHAKEELSFYSKATTDIEYNYPMGWGELWGIADRTDYDLSVHINHSKADLRYLDPETNEKYIPYVIEPSVGLDRLVLALLTDAYSKELVEDEERLVLKIHPFLAPYKVSIFPLIKKIHAKKAMEIYGELAKDFMCSYDESGSIGKRYRRSDAIGTPFAITIDDETLKNKTVTVRDRDTMQQTVMSIDEFKKFLKEKIDF